MGSDIVIATAGHVDHGKSSLVKALTGYDPDRLPEEKNRGLTIDIGFGHISSSNQRISFVDLPGHENYVKNMIAGVTGADGAILCIDINEGIMPQTLEHTNILKLIDIKELIVALTKSAGMGENKKHEIEKKVSSFLKSYNFELVKIVFTDISMPETIENIRKLILDFGRRFSSVKENLPFMLRVDRVFNKKGFGTVVTGTTVFGKISTGDSVQIFPGGEIVKIRNINIHGKSANLAKAHQRTALNLVAVSSTTLKRGAVIAKTSQYKEFTTFLGEISLFENSQHISLKSDKIYHIYIGTDHNDAKITLLGRKTMKNNERCFCKIRFENSLKYPGFPGDIFLLRGGYPLTTIGGGRLITPDLKFNNKLNLEILECSKKSVESALSKTLEFSPYLKFESMHQYFSMDLQNALTNMKILKFGDFLLKYETVLNWTKKIKSSLEISRCVSLSKIVPLELLKNDSFFTYFKEHFFGIFSKDAFQMSIFEISKRGLSGFEILGINILEKMENDTSLSNASVISREMAISDKEAEKCIKFLENREMVKKIDANNYISNRKYKKFIEDAKILAAADGYVDISNVRKIMDAPRKIVIPLMDCLDKLNIFFVRDRKRYLKD